MNLTEQQRRMIRAILSVFETGKVRGDPAALVVLPDGAGISYGIHQGTRASGSLYAIVDEYVERGGTLAADLAPFLGALKRRNPALDGDAAFKGLLRRAGTDPVMREAQESVFDRNYFEPALRKATSLGLESALGVAVVYDGLIHGGFDRIAAGLGRADDERAWLGRYLRKRREWLAHHKKAILHGTVYRPDTFLRQLAAGNLDLAPPIVAHGRTIRAEDVDGPEPLAVAAVVPAPEPAAPVPVVVEQAGTVVTTEAPAPTTPVPGGAVDDPALKANKEGLIAKMLKWVGGSTGVTALLVGAADRVSSLTGLTPEAQILIIKWVLWAGLIFGVLAIIVAAVDHLQTKYIRARPDLQNTK